MKAGHIIIAVAAAFAPTVAHAESYDCTLGNAQVVMENEGNISGSEISFGGEAADPWTFKLVTAERTSTINWPESPIQLSGEAPRIRTGTASFASFHVGRGPCMFAEGHCGAIVHYSEQADATLSLLVQPIALNRMSGDVRVPFLAYVPGNCTAETNP